MLAAVTGNGDHVRRNRAVWDRWAAEYAGPGLRNWAAAEPTWGMWNIAEAQTDVLPADLEGRQSIELGCGTGYVSAWLARRGARPVGLSYRLRLRPMISFMTSVVPPKFHGICGLPQELPSSGA